MLIKFTGAIITIILLQSCIANRSFVASGYEPVNVENKGDVEVNASLRGFKYAKFNGTFAITNWLAVRGGYGGTYQLDNFDGSLIFYKNFKKIGLFIAPSYNYQHNLIKRNYSSFMFERGETIQNNCEFDSPSLVTGIKLFKTRNSNHQIIVKTAYNIVKQYKYSYSLDNASGKNDYYERKDSEELDYKIANFFSVEPSYSYTGNLNELLMIRFQVGFNFCQKTLKHNYIYRPHQYSEKTKDASKLHPVTLPMNISIGLIFKHSFKKSPTEE